MQNWLYLHPIECNYHEDTRSHPGRMAADMVKSVKVPFSIKDIPASEAASEEMKQRMTEKSNVIWLPVTINGKKYEFILDTGASYSAFRYGGPRTSPQVQQCEHQP